MGGAGSTPLATFASEVIARARQVQAQAQARDDENGGLWGRHKVFISEIGTSAEFKESLLNAHRQGLLRLTRLDMSPMLSSAQKEMVGKGEIRHMNGLFHVIDLE